MQLNVRLKASLHQSCCYEFHENPDLLHTSYYSRQLREVEAMKMRTFSHETEIVEKFFRMEIS